MFPKIKGLKWLSDDCPDLIEVKTILLDKKQFEMDLPNGPDEIEASQYCDLSKLAGVRDFYPEMNEISNTECMVDFSGMPSMIIKINKHDMLKAWLVYKQFNYKNNGNSN